MGKQKDKKRQHFIPQFFIRRWIDSGNVYTYFDKSTSTNKKGNLTNENNDVFYGKYLYEDLTRFKMNYIEDQLSEMESASSEVITKILSRKDHQKIQITREELTMIKIYIVLQKFRSLSFKERLEKDGDIEAFFTCLNEIYNNIFKPIKLGHNLATDPSLYTGSGIDYDLQYIFFGTYLNFIKLNNTSNTFISNDLASARFPNDQSPAFEAFPLSPDFAVLLVKTDGLGLNINTLNIYNPGHIIAQEIFGTEYVWKNIEHNYREEIISGSKKSWSKDDKYTYPIINEERDYAVWILNHWLANVSSNLLLTQNNEYYMRGLMDISTKNTLLKGIFKVKVRNIQKEDWDHELMLD
ncbi:DUF4238 domain-containing protein [[Acholeplasma] multilocale]|uniref:DUF4238 domain-containing protein n=1 Tax=[Acholeplasma] multilocale TaxID=264638 RepID=UPI00047C88E8|nr:DUF4238 domain-containing protein [[Acholeplasma] multilocale]